MQGHLKMRGITVDSHGYFICDQFLWILAFCKMVFFLTHAIVAYNKHAHLEAYILCQYIFFQKKTSVILTFDTMLNTVVPLKQNIVLNMVSSCKQYSIEYDVVHHNL